MVVVHEAKTRVPYSLSRSPCSEMLSSDEERRVRGLNDRERQERGEGCEGLIWRLHAATISSTQNGADTLLKYA